MIENKSKTKEVLVKVRNLKMHFPVGNKKVLKAVDDVSFDIYRGETLGLVGESGCGKTTCGRAILGIYQATSGSVQYKGLNVFSLKKNEKKVFDKECQMIFQDPYASLNPRILVGNIIGEGIDIHKLHKNSQRENRIQELLNMVGLNKEHKNRFPHEFSGGQRQRIGIARSLAVQPEFIVCDEPISALDVSVQAQVVNLLQELQNEYQFTYLFVAHDLSMVRYISDRVAVMYLGSFVELADSKELYDHPLHPYTKALLSAIPLPDPKVQRERKRIPLEGDVPSPISPPAGCKFHTRCFMAEDICKKECPKFKEVKPGHFVACHLVH
ncbi:MAG: ATP-binding cassette domain-containing protein [Spirochaetes bacterium]|nr:ATP-binding cassette domain-containing protein [Spirochaetota bacterium]